MKMMTLSEIAEIVGGTVHGDPGREIFGVAPFDHAGETDITLAAGGDYLKRLDATRAGAVIVPKGVNKGRPDLVEVDNPQAAFARVMQIFIPGKKPQEGIHRTASVGEHFSCGRNVSIGPCTVIGDDVTMGDNVSVMGGAFVGDHVVIGDDVMIHPNVSILHGCAIGSRVTIHAGTVIGSDGFGFAPEGEVYVKIPHSGTVQIDDDVEIGAVNTIDRGTFGKTWIKRGVKTDNLVHIAHNVVVGENTIIVAQVGVAGSTTIGRHVILAGQAGISGHIEIGDNAIIGPQAGIVKTVGPGEVVSGTPGIPHKLWLRAQSIVARLPSLKKRISEIEKRLASLEKRQGKE